MLEGAVSALRERAEAAERHAEAAERRADAAEAAIAAERQRANAVEVDRRVAQIAEVEAEAEATRLRADLEAAHRLVETAQGRADARAQAEAARKGRGRLARLRAAWRGE